MKKILLLFTSFALFITACKKDLNKELGNENNFQEPKLSTQQINSFIKNQYSQKGSFDWKEASDEMVWSALQNSDKIVSIGYKPANESDIDNRIATINISDAEWTAAKQQVLKIIFDEERKKITCY